MLEAVTHALDEEAEKQGLTCSREHEVLQENDPLTGDFNVRLRFWGSTPRSLRISVNVGASTGSGGSHAEGAPGAGEATGVRQRRRLDLEVHYSVGDDVVLGRDSHLQRRESLLITTRTSPERVLADKMFLKAWLEECFNKWIQPVEGVVKIYALQESSREWIPE